MDCAPDGSFPLTLAAESVGVILGSAEIGRSAAIEVVLIEQSFNSKWTVQTLLGDSGKHAQAT
jgi:hypothetical protein